MRGGYEQPRGNFRGGRGGGFGRDGMMEYTNDYSRGRGAPRGGRPARPMRMRGAPRGGRLMPRGRGGYPMALDGYPYQDPYLKQEPEKDKRVVYFNFPSAITDKGATDLMEFGKSATLMHFGWKCCFTLETEAAAMEMEAKLLDMEFNGQKPNVDTSHRAQGEAAKRTLTSDGDNSPTKKKKTEDDAGEGDSSKTPEKMEEEATAGEGGGEVYMEDIGESYEGEEDGKEYSGNGAVAMGQEPYEPYEAEEEEEG